MSFDTKYLIRWGIPGWLMILTVFPFVFITYMDKFKWVFQISALDILSISATLGFLGVPIGYLLGQIHHSLFWVIPRCFKWKTYFEEEFKLDQCSLKNCEYHKDRYSYLLAKKHETGAVAMSFTVSFITVLLINVFYIAEKWSWYYLFVVGVLMIITMLNRFYSSGNVEYYSNEYLNQ